jgi:hypothetical protein
MLVYCFENLPLPEAERISFAGEDYKLETEMEKYIYFDLEKYT